MDKQIPGMDGLEATQRIRSSEKQKGGYTHIIALTVAATPEDREQCLEAGMDDYLTKPVDIAALLQKLNALFPEGGMVAEELAEEEAEQSSLSIEDHESLIHFEQMPVSWKNDPAKKEKYIALMKNDIQQSLQRLEMAIQDGDSTALSKAAHKLKGVIGKLRSETIRELVQDLKSLKRQDDQEQASLLLKRLKKELHPFLTNILV